MRKHPTGKEYRVLLGRELGKLLPDGFAPREDQPGSYRRTTGFGCQQVGLHLSTKFWPDGNFSLWFGVYFDDLRELFSEVVDEHQIGAPHLSQSTGDIHMMRGLLFPPRILFTKLPFIWRFINLGHWPCYREQNPAVAIRQVKSTLCGVVRPFFKRFSSIEEGWNAMRDDDGWTWQGSSYRQALAFGVFLQDWKGVRRAQERLKRHYHEDGRQKVDDYVERLKDYCAKLRS